MNNTQNSRNKNAIPKWFLAAVLFLSLFAFSGSSVQIQAKHDAQQTTLLAGNSTTVVKSIGFNRALRFVCNQRLAGFLYVGRSLNLVDLHSRQAIISLKNHACPNLPIKQTAFLYRVSNPSETPADSPNPSLG